MYVRMPNCLSLGAMQQVQIVSPQLPCDCLWAYADLEIDFWTFTVAWIACINFMHQLFSYD